MAIEKTLRWIVLGGAFALPFIVFIVATSFYFPFITGKNFAFRIIVEIMTGAYLTLALVNPAYRPKRSWLLGAFATFVFVVALADAFGAYPFKSFWSNYERMDGWITLVHLFVYFVVIASVLNTAKLWKRLWQLSLAVAGAVALYGLLQVAGFASLNPGFSSAARIDATFGNPIYLAVYMLFHVGIAALLLAHTWRDTRPGTRAWPLILYGGAIALFTLILFMTGTRGTMLGLIGGGILGAYIYMVSAGTMFRIVIGSTIGIIVLASGSFLMRDTALVRSIPFFERLATISLEDNTTKARLMNWDMAWQGVKARPILGWGQENYAVVFDKYYNPDMYGQEQWFDRVHNVVFDWLVAAGILGFLSYFSLFAAALWLLWRKASDALFSTAERAILTGLLAAYVFHNLFVFDNILSYILFATTLSYIAWRASVNAAPIPFPNIDRQFVAFVALAAIALVWGTAWYVNARPMNANRILLQALQAQQSGITRNLELFKESISYNTTGVQEAREQLSQAAAQVAGSDAPAEAKQAFYAAAVEEMSAMMEGAPLNARFPLFLGVVHKTYGNYEQADMALAKAVELSPNKQTILFELGSNRFTAGDADGALETFKTAFELAPEFLGARINYAAVAIRLGRDALADELLTPVMGSGAADPRIAAAYVTRGRYDKIASIWEAEVAANPQNAQAYFTLAAAYFEMGAASQAVATLQRVSSEVPSAKTQADALIDQIRSGTLEI